MYLYFVKFTELGLSDQLLESLSYMGFEDATPIQEQAIPAILNGKDLLACAQTGTGKTAAFMLPVLHLISQSNHDGVQALVVVPTRELAMQIDLQIQGFSYFVEISSIAIYGGGDGMDWEQQKKALKSGVDIVIATPGKLLSHLNQNYVDFSKIKYLILDEADRMLDIGFYDDIINITKHLPEKKQSLLFSATMPKKIVSLSKTLLTNPLEIKLAISKPAEGVMQIAYLAHDTQKVSLLESLLRDKPTYTRIIIFCSTKKKVNEIVRKLSRSLRNVAAISSDFSQERREEVINQFKAKKVRILVATDVISRGVDIKDINLVVNYDVPTSAEDYVHRIGRTARADTTGIAITLINSDDVRNFMDIEELIESEVMKVPMPKELGQGPEYKVVKRSFHRKGKSSNRKYAPRKK